MKYLTFILSALIIMSCNQSPTKNENKNSNNLDKIFGKKLIENGFLDYANSLKVDSLKIGILKSFNIYDEDHNKFVKKIRITKSKPDEAIGKVLDNRKWLDDYIKNHDKVYVKETEK